MALEAFFVALTSPVLTRAMVSDPQFGERLQRLWLDMHAPLATSKGIINVSRYIPLWQRQFMSNSFESDRLDIVIKIQATRTFLECALAVPSGSTAPMPTPSDFLCLSISQFHIKMAYFLLLARHDETEVDVRASVADMTPQIYAEGAPMWESAIIRDANRRLVPKEESPSRVTESIPEPKLAETIFAVVRDQVELMLLDSQIKKSERVIDLWAAAVAQVETVSANIRASRFSAMASASSLDFLAQALEDVEPTHSISHLPEKDSAEVPVSTTPYIVQTDIVNTQFEAELAFSHIKLVEVMHSVLSRCQVRVVDDELLIDGQGIDALCWRLSHFLTQFTTDSENALIQTWRRYLVTIAIENEANGELMNVVGIMGKFSSARFEKQAMCEIGSKFQTRFMELNTLRHRLHKLHEIKALTEQNMEIDIREHFAKLLVDLGETTERQKQKAVGAKRRVYDNVLHKINRAKNVALRVRTSDQIEEDQTYGPGPKLDEAFLEGIRVGNAKMRKEIIALRLCRCLNEIAVHRAGSKRLRVIEAERREGNVFLWGNRLKCLAEEESMEEKLHRTHHRLSQTQEAIEKLKTQLENEKMGNIQLVHWKANNLKTIDEMDRQLNEFASVGDVNVDLLLRRLTSAHAELDELREYAAEFDEVANADVRNPISEIATMWNEINLVTRNESASRSTKSALALDRQKQRTKEAFSQRIKDENERLKEENDVLRDRILELESEKMKKSMQVKAIMEETLAHRGLSIRARTRLAKKVVRPVTGGRAVSRFG
jgi:hypothetical protein